MIDCFGAFFLLRILLPHLDKNMYNAISLGQLVCKTHFYSKTSNQFAFQKRSTTAKSRSSTATNVSMN